MSTGVAVGARPLGLLMTGRQLSNIMEYHVRPDVRRAARLDISPTLPQLPPPSWRVMTRADVACSLPPEALLVLSDDARLVAAPPCARSSSGLPGVATLILATEAGDRMTLLDRLEHALAVAMESGTDCGELFEATGAGGDWLPEDILAALARLVETGAVLIRD